MPIVVENLDVQVTPPSEPPAAAEQGATAPTKDALGKLAEAYAERDRAERLCAD
jgi:hypothetical protein